KRFGVIRIHPLVLARAGEDRTQGGNESWAFAGTAIDFKRQGFLRVQAGSGHEPWAGQSFRTGQPFAAFGNVLLFRSLNLGANLFYREWASYYDPVHPFQGRATTGGVTLGWQPNQHFMQYISYNGVRFEHSDTGVPVYSVDIVNAKTVYQFNKQFLIRLL